MRPETACEIINSYADHVWVVERYAYEGSEMMLEARPWNSVDYIEGNTVATVRLMGVSCVRSFQGFHSAALTIERMRDQKLKVQWVRRDGGAYQFVCSGIDVSAGSEPRRSVQPVWGTFPPEHRLKSAVDLVASSAGVALDRLIMWEQASNHSGLVYVGNSGGAVLVMCVVAHTFLDSAVESLNVSLALARSDDLVEIETRLNGKVASLRSSVERGQTLKINCDDGIHYISAGRFAISPYELLRLDPGRLGSAATVLRGA